MSFWRPGTAPAQRTCLPPLVGPLRSAPPQPEVPGADDHDHGEELRAFPDVGVASSAPAAPDPADAVGEGAGVALDVLAATAGLAVALGGYWSKPRRRDEERRPLRATVRGEAGEPR